MKNVGSLETDAGRAVGGGPGMAVAGSRRAVTRRVENGASARGEPLSTTTGHAPRADDGHPVG
jgi:hypothetical protein